MLPIPSASNFPIPAVSWSEVARACRRICVLRERGLTEEADRLQTGELAQLLESLRPSIEEPVLQRRLAEIFATETERVANASVLAELLVPMLGAQHVAAPVRAAAAATPPLEPVAIAPEPEPERPPGPRPGAGSIADFIDEMIAQENSGAGGPRGRRRAS